MEYTGKMADPEWRLERARKARAAVGSSPEAHVRWLVANAGKLTPEMAREVRDALPPAER